MNFPNDYVLSAEDLGYRYPKGFQLQKMTLRIPRGRTIGIVGRSGCGKSTLVGLLGLLIDPRLAQGRIVFNSSRREEEVVYGERSGAVLLDVRRRSFGYALQSAFLQRNLTAEHNVILPLLAAGETYRKAAAKLDSVVAQWPSEVQDDFREFRHKRAAGISLGQRRRLAVLRAIIHEPEVIIADEPFANLDPYNRELFARLLQFAHEMSPRETDDRSTLLLVTHETDIVRERCDGVFVVEDGRLHACHRGGGGLPIPPAVFREGDWLERHLVPRRQAAPVASAPLEGTAP